MNTKRIIGIYASQDYGKTFLTRWLIEKQIAEHVPVFVYDTNFESKTNYAGLKNTFIVHTKTRSNMEDPATFNQAILNLRSKQSNFFFVVEDIDKLFTTAGKTKETQESFKLSSDSRHQRIGMIYLSKTPTNIPPILRGNTNLFFFGNFVEPASKKYISEIVDKDLFKGIKKRQFVLYDVWEQKTARVEISDGDLREIP